MVGCSGCWQHFLVSYRCHVCFLIGFNPFLIVFNAFLIVLKPFLLSRHSYRYIARRYRVYSYRWYIGIHIVISPEGRGCLHIVGMQAFTSLLSLYQLKFISCVYPSENSPVNALMIEKK